MTNVEGSFVSAEEAIETFRTVRDFFRLGLADRELERDLERFREPPGYAAPRERVRERDRIGILGCLEKTWWCSTHIGQESCTMILKLKSPGK